MTALSDRHRRRLQEVSDFRGLPGQGRDRRLREGRARRRKRAASGKTRSAGEAAQIVVPDEADWANARAARGPARRPIPCGGTHDLRRHHRLGQVHAARRAHQRRSRDVPGHRRRVDHVAHGHPRAARLARHGHRACRTSPRRARSPARDSMRRTSTSSCYGSCSQRREVPNSASGVQFAPGRARTRRRWTSTPRARASSTGCRPRPR